MNTNRLLYMLCCTASITAGILFYLAAFESTRLTRTSALQAGKLIEHGAALYSLHCRTCHGSRGEGIGQLGPPLSDEHFFRHRLKEVGWQSTLEDYVSAVTAYGRMMGTRPIYAGNGSTAVMPIWQEKYGGPLRADEISEIGRFILNWEATALGRVVLEQVELPRRNVDDGRTVAAGERVFLDKCAACHTYREIAEAQISGPDLSEFSTVGSYRRDGYEGIDYLKESVLIPRAYLVEGFADLAEQYPCGGVLTESELDSVCSFLLH